jgi:hypothetical protein
MITVARDKAESCYVTGIAWGYWGSQVASAIRKYGDYERQSKFVRFVDKWHPILYAGDATA